MIVTTPLIRNGACTRCGRHWRVCRDDQTGCDTAPRQVAAEEPPAPAKEPTWRGRPPML